MFLKDHKEKMIHPLDEKLEILSLILPSQMIYLGLLDPKVLLALKTTLSSLKAQYHVPHDFECQLRCVQMVITDGGI